MMVRESTLDDTWKAMRLGMLALMRPVITSTEGRWVARMRCTPEAPRLLSETGDELFHLLPRDHHEVRQLVDDHHDHGQGFQRKRLALVSLFLHLVERIRNPLSLSPGLFDLAVEPADVAHPRAPT